MKEDARAESPAAEDDFAAVTFLSLAGLGLSLWLAANGAFADWLLTRALDVEPQQVVLG